MGMMSSDVWERGGSDEMSRNVFYLVLCAVLSWGFILTMLVAKSTAAWHPDIFTLLVVCLSIPIVGICLSVWS
jgi:hypothetical protein